MARRPFIEAAEEQLPRHGYRIIRVTRTVGICHWLLARRTKDNQLVELEVYDRALTNPLLLTGYVNHSPMQQSNGNGQTRYPIEQINTDRLFAFVRPWLRGEPLVALLLRPGRIPADRVRAVVVQTGAALRLVLQETELPMPTAVANLFLAEDNTVVLDSAAEGPWLTASDATALVTPFFRDGDGDEASAQRFLELLYVRLTTGSIRPNDERLETLRDAKMIALEEATQVSRLLARDKPSGWLDLAIAPRRRQLPWRSLAVLALAVLIGGAAVSQHRRLSVRAWAGKIEEPPPPRPAAPTLPAGDAARPTDENRAVYVPYRLAEARREAKAGAYASAFAVLGELERNPQIEGEDRVAVRRARTEINAATAAAFTATMDRGRSLYEAGEEETSLRLLETAIETFPDNPQMRQATDLAAAIRHVQRERLRREIDADLAQRRSDKLRQEQIQAILDLHLPVGDRRYRGHLRLAQERLRGTPEAELLRLLHEAAVAEENLYYGMLTTAAGPRARQLVTACTPAWAEGKAVRINEIRAGGIVEIGPDGLNVVQWSQISFTQLLHLFEAGRGIVAPDDHDYTLSLYRYCLRRQLPEVERYAAALAGTRHQRLVNRTRNLWQRLEGTASPTADDAIFGGEEN